MAVVLFIMALMLTIATPYLSSLTGAQMRAQARELAGLTSYLYNEAQEQRAVYRLTFDLDANRYRTSRLDPSSPKPAFQPAAVPGSAGGAIAQNVRLRDVTIAGLGTFKHGSVSCQFYPDGYVDPVVVHLIDSSGEVFTISLNPLTGQASIVKADLDQGQAALEAQ
jgi:Tfp pilus assembly protein FimT